MLPAIDVGNTHRVRDSLRRQARTSTPACTHKDRTADEMAIKLGGFLMIEDRSLKEAEDVIVSSVVPEMTGSLGRMAREILKLEPVVAVSEADTGMPILYDDPRQLDPDRIVNGVTAVEKHGKPRIVIDLGNVNTLGGCGRRLPGGRDNPGTAEHLGSALQGGRAPHQGGVDRYPQRHRAQRRRVHSVRAGIRLRGADRQAHPAAQGGARPRVQGHRHGRPGGNRFPVLREHRRHRPLSDAVRPEGHLRPGARERPVNRRRQRARHDVSH
ncbi:MAG: type III pantothenate kinase [Actinobacteria bacterium]|nr:type III pantothenate kinase [Actinomycetota bacterium]